MRKSKQVGLARLNSAEYGMAGLGKARTMLVPFPFSSWDASRQEKRYGNRSSIHCGGSTRWEIRFHFHGFSSRFGFQLSDFDFGSCISVSVQAAIIGKCAGSAGGVGQGGTVPASWPTPRPHRSELFVRPKVTKPEGGRPNSNHGWQTPQAPEPNVVRCYAPSQGLNDAGGVAKSRVHSRYPRRGEYETT